MRKFLLSGLFIVAAMIQAGATTWTGSASYYATGSHTASGAMFRAGGMTAAHRSLPLGTRLLVTNLANGRSVQVVVNDRGPFVGGRLIDLSRGAADVLGFRRAGVARVRVAVIGS